MMGMVRVMSVVHVNVRKNRIKAELRCKINTEK